MTDDRTLQGLKKEATQAINKAAKSTNKEDRLKAAEQAKNLLDVFYKKVCAHEEGAKKADNIQSKT